MISERVSSTQAVMPQRSSYHNENSVISRPIRLPWTYLRNRKSGGMVSEQSRNSSMGQATSSGTAGARGYRNRRRPRGHCCRGRRLLGATSAPALDTSPPPAAARRPPVFQGLAIEASGPEKLGNSTMAIIKAAIQKMWLCVKSASSASTPTICI